MKSIRRALAIIREYHRTYVVLNIVYYGLVVGGMIFVAFFPSLQESLLALVGKSFREGPLKAVVEAYAGKKVLSAMLLTFAVNLVLGSFAVITLPSLVVPFSGLAIGAWRAVMWGLLLSPTSEKTARAMIPHSLTLILEGQGYILAMLAVSIHGKSFLWPRSVGAQGRWRGYGEGVRCSARLYLLVAIVLAAAAVYEALEVIYLIPALAGGGG